MRRSFVLFLLFMGLTAGAQAPFQRLYYDTHTLYSSTHLVAEAANGDLVEAYLLVTPALDTCHLIFRRFDANGGLLQATRITPMPGIYLELPAALELPDGGFLLFGADYSWGAVVHVDAQGQVQRVYRCSCGIQCFYRSAFWANDSTIMALGEAYVQDTTRMLISRFNTAGEHLGTQAYTIGEAGADGVVGMRCTAGGVLIAAQGADTLGNGSSSNSTRTCLLRLDDAGDVLWARRYGWPGHLLHPLGLAEAPDGSVLVGASAWDMTSQQSTSVLLHVSAQGDTLSARSLFDADAPSASLYTSAFVANTDTSVLFTGFTLDGGHLLTCRHNGTPLLAARTPGIATFHRPVRAAAGDLLIPEGAPFASGPSPGAAVGLCRTADPFASDCLVPRIPGSVPVHLWIGQGCARQPINVVLDDITAQCTQSTSTLLAYDPCLSTAVPAMPQADPEIRLWPVPASDGLTVSAPHLQRIDILDEAGRVVLTMAAHGEGILQVDITRLASGPYQVRITSGGTVRVRRMIKA